MNKFDLLRKKIARGIMVADSVLNFKDRPNDAKTAAKCKFPVIYVHRLPSN